MGNFYDGTKLLSMMDINGKKPELYLCTTNRTGGKTTYFNRLLVNRFLKDSEKFCLVYRFSYELDNVAEKFFDDIRALFFQDYTMTSMSRANGMYHELFLHRGDEQNKKGVSCGYAVALNMADQIKKNSHMFADVKRMLMDEFQSETNHYCANEVQKLISVHTSIARGRGKQVRYVPVYMIANPVTILNPYYVELGVCDRLTMETNFLRGDGYVLEQGFVESAASAQKESAFNRAFAGNRYTAYGAQGIYLNDNSAFIERPEGRSKYLATLRYNGTEYAIRSYADLGIIYCDTHVDKTFRGKISVTTEDHQINYVMLKENKDFLNSMKYYFNLGCFRFRNMRCKECVMKALSY